MDIDDDFDDDFDDAFEPAAAAAAAGAGAGDHNADDDDGNSSNVYAAYNAYYDEEVGGDSQALPPPVAIAPHNDDNSDSSSDSNNADDSNASDNNKDIKDKAQSSTQRNKPSKTTGKRRKRSAARFENATDDDDDNDEFESQQSILKWVRTVPGPLQDVIKHQQATLDAVNSGTFASGSSVGTGAMISTVFDDGPWVAMCAFLGLATTPGKLYGGIRMSSLQHTLSYILEDDQSSPKIPRLLLLVKSMKYVDDEIVAVFHDPSGEIEGYFHRDIVEQLGPALGAGTGVLLRKVSVFTPTDATLVGRRRSYLNITPRNLQRVFLPKSQVATSGAAVEVFNSERAALVAEEDAADESNRKQGEEAQRLLQHDALRHASTELSYLSQRQVVHRNPPVRPDPSDAAAGGAALTGDAGAGGKKSKKKKKADESASGLGRWEWARLAQRKSTAPVQGTTAAARSSATPTIERESSASQLLPTSRFTALLSRQIATKRRSSDTGVSASASATTAGSLEERGGDDNGDSDNKGDGDGSCSRVRFASAPQVVEIAARFASSSADVSENEEAFAHDDTMPQPAPLRELSVPPPPSSLSSMRSVRTLSTPSAGGIDDDDDDDDW